VGKTEQEARMGFKAVLYIGLLGLGVGCSNSDPRLQGERELLD